MKFLLLLGMWIGLSFSLEAEEKENKFRTFWNNMDDDVMSLDSYFLSAYQSENHREDNGSMNLEYLTPELGLQFIYKPSTSFLIDSSIRYRYFKCISLSQQNKQETDDFTHGDLLLTNTLWVGNAKAVMGMRLHTGMRDYITSNDEYLYGSGISMKFGNRYAILTFEIDLYEDSGNNNQFEIGFNGEIHTWEKCILLMGIKKIDGTTGGSNSISGWNFHLGANLKF